MTLSLSTFSYLGNQRAFCRAGIQSGDIYWSVDPSMLFILKIVIVILPSLYCSLPIKWICRLSGSNSSPGTVHRMLVARFIIHFEQAMMAASLTPAGTREHHNFGLIPNQCNETAGSFILVIRPSVAFMITLSHRHRPERDCSSYRNLSSFCITGAVGHKLVVASFPNCTTGCRPSVQGYLFRIEGINPSEKSMSASDYPSRPRDGLCVCLCLQRLK